MARIASAARLLIASASALLLAACTLPLVPPSYSGPTATLQDSVERESATIGRVYAAVAIDIQRIDSAFDVTRVASGAGGFNVSLIPASRSLVPKPMRVKLRAARVTGAFVHGMLLEARHALYKVEGDVEFTPKADTLYVVRGRLGPDGRNQVWIEESETGTKATAVVGANLEKP
jgi:hypothetical protein